MCRTLQRGFWWVRFSSWSEFCFFPVKPFTIHGLALTELQNSETWLSACCVYHNFFLLLLILGSVKTWLQRKKAVGVSGIIYRHNTNNLRNSLRKTFLKKLYSSFQTVHLGTDAIVISSLFNLLITWVKLWSEIHQQKKNRKVKGKGATSTKIQSKTCLFDIRYVADGNFYLDPVCFYPQEWLPTAHTSFLDSATKSQLCFSNQTVRFGRTSTQPKFRSAAGTQCDFQCQVSL